MDLNLDYPVRLEQDTNGSTAVSFADVHEAHTFGADADEALLRAVDALETALEMYVDESQDIPPASKPKGGQRTVRPRAQTCIKLGIYQTMRDEGIRKSELARRLGWHMPQVDRLLDLHHASRLDQAELAAHALGRDLSVRVEVREG